MFWFKACPKCGGDLAEDRDMHGTYISCLACGRYLTELEERALRYPAAVPAKAEAREEKVAQESAA